MKVWLYESACDATEQELWLDRAREGELWVPNDVGTTQALAMVYVMREWRDPESWMTLHEDIVPTLIIDCQQGHENSHWPLWELEWRYKHGLQTRTIVIGKAYSIALSYAITATERLALPDAQWAFHGGGSRGDAGLQEDQAIVDCITPYTKRPEAEWLEWARDGTTNVFGVDEALEWGIVDRIVEEF
jgi:hypothetical protein